MERNTLPNPLCDMRVAFEFELNRFHRQCRVVRASPHPSLRATSSQSKRQKVSPPLLQACDRNYLPPHKHASNMLFNLVGHFWLTAKKKKNPKKRQSLLFLPQRRLAHVPAGEPASTWLPNCRIHFMKAAQSEPQILTDVKQDKFRPESGICRAQSRVVTKRFLPLALTPFSPAPPHDHARWRYLFRRTATKALSYIFQKFIPGRGGGGYLDYPFDDRPAVPCSHKTSQAKAVKMDPERYPVLLSGYNYARVVERVGALQSN
jgi:hypothetical protein